ncbi:dol-P-Glc:Glc(2)Man(9)GlcNAc(2)-PP-Dol alpha-1,2-glucosyltransferase isoform X2 [Colius striatus]|uniref:dol-P-Glc:Glc(2)Man(9)GlcNAc(2)-PP-Dol alpha-1,2-glucosyltransferase isoform X2 n=1 Tax=Colius striatus TaxID=57412 RepID=UPI002B1D4F97|nr:dol-P-Glc:Glc(2)Man(9)GlcNAc(2)-PP-Dol alpha-1,2-glucosyltransferase isoform X2 [Colius striatus]
MERPEAYGFSAAMSGSFLLSCLLFAAVSRHQRGPYMDEVFHVPQAQAYCHGRFLQWDPMITTLPGLYLVSVGVVKPAVWLFGWTGSVVCSVGMLRFINLLFSAGNFYLLYLLLLKIHQKNKDKTSDLSSPSASTPCLPGGTRHRAAAVTASTGEHGGV